MEEISNVVTVPQAPLFTIVHQKVDLEIDFRREVRGRSEITIHPETRDLKSIKLHSRHCRVDRVTVNGLKADAVRYEDPCDTLCLHTDSTVHQHHILSEKIRSSVSAQPAENLTITLPSSLRIEPNKEAVISNAGTTKTSKLDGDTEDIESAQTLNDVAVARFTPLTLVLHYNTTHLREALHFVSAHPGSGRWPHVFTLGGFTPGRASALFPCLDVLQSRCTWDISIKFPKTVGEAVRQALSERSKPGGDDPSNKSSDEDFTYEFREMVVVCTGDLSDDVVDKTDPTKRTVSFSCTNSLSPRQIGFAIGPFEKVDLSVLRDAQEVEELGGNAVEMATYCLPGRVDEAKNTCLPTTKAMDWFVRKYLACPFTTFSTVFVEDVPAQTYPFAEVTICSTKLLYPSDVIDTAQEHTRQIVHAIASQWIGVSIIPEQPEDVWVTIGASYFITELFMKDLCGNNEYRFRMKQLSDTVCEMDHERPSLYDMGTLLHLDPAEYNFMALKAPIVLFILDRRMAKTTGVSKMPSIIAKIMTKARTEDLKNNAVSTDYFVRMVERFFHNRVDDFVNQWVKGAGCPRFSASQRFNKKKLVIEMSIRQTQASLVSERELQVGSFIRDVREDLNSVYAAPQQNVFTGPMTIRIHEADGTPYEHIVEIKDATTNVEVPYNTKYKRLKRSKRQRSRAANKAAEGAEEENDSLVYCLGDTLQNEEEVARWRLTEWSADDEEKMNSESFEWIRLDADFEWICSIRLAMPGYMFVSQLQQDRDVAAQLESIQHIRNYQASPLISTILLRTMIDGRYFHGIRSAAALALVKHATYEHECNMIGLFHLRKAFEELYCSSENGPRMTRPNDFSNPLSYFLQSSIVKAISRVRDTQGHTPKEVKEFLLDKLRFNDNTVNEYSDAFYVSKLMTGLTYALLARPKRPTDPELDLDTEAEFADLHYLETTCLEEIDRYRRMDEWTSSYQNLYSCTALRCRAELAKAGIGALSSLYSLQYTRPGNYDMLRFTAYDNLIQADLFDSPSILRYVTHCMVADASPWIREELRQSFGRALAKKAIGEMAPSAPNADGLIIEDVNADARQRNLARRQNVDAALDALKKELGENSSLKELLWQAITYPESGHEDLRALLEYCKMLYPTSDEARVRLKLPRYWKMKNLGKGKLVFTRTNKTRSKILPKWKPQAPVVAPNAPRQPVKLTFKKKDSAPVQSRPSATPKASRPPASVPVKEAPKPPAQSGRPILKLKFGPGRPSA